MVILLLPAIALIYHLNEFFWIAKLVTQFPGAFKVPNMFPLTI